MGCVWGGIQVLPAFLSAVSIDSTVLCSEGSGANQLCFADVNQLGEGNDLSISFHSAKNITRYHNYAEACSNSIVFSNVSPAYENTKEE